MFKSVHALPCVLIAFFLISWGYEGHQVIARIAENHLTPEAKTAIKQLLGDKSIVDIASWADEVRDEPEWKFTAPWHYINLPLGLSAAEFKNRVENSSNPSLYTALVKCETEIGDPGLTADQKANDLKFLVHFVGDAHQPMHVSRAEDKGGSTIQVQFDNRGTNLHSVWDTKLIDRQGLTYAQMAKADDKATPAEIGRLLRSGPVDWMFESYQLSTRLYAEVEENNKLGEAYYDQHIGIVNRRLEEAGIRLAGLLNRLFKNGVKFKNSPTQPTVAPPVAPLSGPAKWVDIHEAPAHYNEEIIVTGKVFGFKDFGSMVLLNLGDRYPKSIADRGIKRKRQNHGAGSGRQDDHGEGKGGGI